MTSEFPKKTPRPVSRRAKLGIWFGQPLYLISAAEMLLVTLGLLMLFLTYGMGFSYLVLLSGDSVEVESTVAEVKQERLASGGLAYMTTAQVKVNEKVVTAFGFGPPAETSKVGDSVTIVVPKAAPSHAYLKGFWPKPVSPGILLQLAIWFYLPGVLGLFLSAQRSWSSHNLLQLGQVTKGKKTKSIGLPRPLKDKELSRWQYLDEEGTERAFWTVQNRELVNPTVLVRGRRAGLAESMLPGWELKDASLHCQNFWQKIFTYLSLVLMLFQILLVILFFFT